MKWKKSIFFIVLVAFFVRLLFFFDYHSLWWDSAVYAGMGKYIWSWAQQGLWEPLRPIFWPLLLGGVWKSGLDIVFFGRIITLIMSLAIIWLTYKISLTFYDGDIALISAALVSFSTLFFFYTFRLYTEIPALFFVLLGFFFLQKKMYLYSGMFVGIAFLTKFPAGIFLVSFLPLILDRKKYKPLIHYGFGFLLTIFPYFVFNQLMYGNFLFPFLSASEVITKVAGCNYLRYIPWHSYFTGIFMENIFYIFAIPGIYFMIKKFDRKNLMLLLSFLLPLIYFIQLHCREQRYIILFVPFLAIISAYGLIELFKRFKGKKYIKLVIIIIILVSSFFAVNNYLNTESQRKITAEEDFLSYAENISGEIWISNPAVSLHTDQKLHLLYYPLYTTQKIEDFQKELIETGDYIFLDTCNGGMTCSPDDVSCPEKTGELISYLKGSWIQKYYNSYGICEYYIFKRK